MRGLAVVVSRMWVVLALSAPWASAADGDQPSINDLRREIAELRKSMDAAPPVEIQNRVDSALALHSSEIPSVQTRTGRLKIGGLLQVWAYHIQNDNKGYTDIGQVTVEGTGSAAQNETVDNDSFGIRRAELRFDVEVHENISAHITIDPAREATAFPSFPTNQASGPPGDHSIAFFDPCLCEGFIADPRAVGTGGGTANRILQEAYINYHDYIPHHDISVGQFKRHLGEEGTRDSGKLKFVERSMITQPADIRDIGMMVHGTWFDDRLQYWAGVFNGPGGAFQQRGNRSDDNDAKDGVFSIYGKPLDAPCSFGTVELGYSILAGTHGEAAGHTPGSLPVNGLNRRETFHLMQYAWAAYHGGGAASGWWTRGEWGQIRDRFAPNAAASGVDVFSSDPATFEIQGWYVATGYHLGDSTFSEGLPSAMRNMEFLFRYDVMENLFYHDLVSPERRFDVFKTQVYTAGINYYILGDHAKLQLNYNWVLEEDRIDKDDRQVREVQNNSLVLNFQAAF